MSAEETKNDQIDGNRESRLTNLGEIYGLTLSEIYQSYNRNEALNSQPGMFDRFLDSSRPTAPDLMSEANFIFRDKLLANLEETGIYAPIEELSNLWEESVQEANDRKPLRSHLRGLPSL